MHRRMLSGSAFDTRSPLTCASMPNPTSARCGGRWEWRVRRPLLFAHNGLCQWMRRALLDRPPPVSAGPIH
ncbi:hypothetical protein ACNKHM_14285 [Shigella sonnei]